MNGKTIFIDYTDDAILTGPNNGVIDKRQWTKDKGTLLRSLSFEEQWTMAKDRCAEGQLTKDLMIR